MHPAAASASCATLTSNQTCPRCAPPQQQGCAAARRKERLWPHIREFADNGIAHTKRMLSALGENGTPCELYAVHGHYADAGEARLLAPNP